MRIHFLADVFQILNVGLSLKFNVLLDLTALLSKILPEVLRNKVELQLLNHGECIDLVGFDAQILIEPPHTLLHVLVVQQEKVNLVRKALDFREKLVLEGVDMLDCCDPS